MSTKLEKKYNSVVGGTGDAGLSFATLLAHHHVTAAEMIPSKVEMIKNRKSPIQDEYIKKYLAEKKLDLTVALEVKQFTGNADFVAIAAPTNYDKPENFFDTSAVDGSD